MTDPAVPAPPPPADDSLGVRALLDSRLAPYLSESDAGALARYLIRRDFAPGEVVLTQGEPSSQLHLVSAGDVAVEVDGAAAGAWLGAGDIIGEVGFILGTPRTATVRAGAHGCTTHAVQRVLLTAVPTPQAQRSATALLAALDIPIRARLRKLAGAAPRLLSACADPCDASHPSIREAAALLSQRDAWATLRATWAFVRQIPFRFGPPRVMASETLKLGHGTAATKANLLVALLRAAGLEAGYVETTLPAACLAPLMPRGYASRLPETLHHAYACARLDGHWIAADAAFSPEILRVLADADPRLRPLVDRAPGADGDCRLTACLPPAAPDGAPQAALGYGGPDTGYDPDTADAMSVTLDKLQGISAERSLWVAKAQSLVAAAPATALQVALFGIGHDATRLHALMRRAQPADPAKA